MSQKQRIVKRLETGRTITNRYAASRFGVASLSSRINELRKEGYPIDTIRNRRGTFYKFTRTY
jgi:biotin operon repressor